jgi:ribosomal protein S18 acetylase RimI-like enzyme
MTTIVEPFCITEYRTSAEDALFRMWRASFRHGLGITDPNPIEGELEYFRATMLYNNRVQLVWRDLELLGVLASKPDSISMLYVDIDHLGQGIGSRLLRLAKAESSGSLSLYTFATNQRACRFFESHGFSIAERGFEPFWQRQDIKYVWFASSAA